MATESQLNTAGRISSHPFADLRSASYARRRTRKVPRESVMRMSCSRDSRSPRGRSARVLAKQRAYQHIADQAWLDDFSAHESHEFAVRHSDEIVLNQRYGRYGALVDRSHGVKGTQRLGEEFGEWARRRISEMRAVREERVRSGTVERESTTMPVDAEDVLGHELLAFVLRPASYPRSLWRRGKPRFPVIHGFGWFGASDWSWQWHRNGSGCWELGYAGTRCEGGELPCSCCGQGNGDMDFDCSCREFGVGEWWELRAPEDVQSCGLVEWVKGPLWDLLRAESESKADEKDEAGYVMSGDEWDIVSSPASYDWSVTSDLSEFEVV